MVIIKNLLDFVRGYDNSKSEKQEAEDSLKTLSDEKVDQILINLEDLGFYRFCSNEKLEEAKKFHRNVLKNSKFHDKYEDYDFQVEFIHRQIFIDKEYLHESGVSYDLDTDYKAFVDLGLNLDDVVKNEVEAYLKINEQEFEFRNFDHEQPREFAYNNFKSAISKEFKKLETSEKIYEVEPGILLITNDKLSEYIARVCEELSCESDFANIKDFKLL